MTAVLAHDENCSTSPLAQLLRKSVTASLRRQRLEGAIPRVFMFLCVGR